MKLLSPIYEENPGLSSIPIKTLTPFFTSQKFVKKANEWMEKGYKIGYVGEQKMILFDKFSKETIKTPKGNYNRIALLDTNGTSHANKVTILEYTQGIFNEYHFEYFQEPKAFMHLAKKAYHKMQAGTEYENYQIIENLLKKVQKEIVGEEKEKDRFDDTKKGKRDLIAERSWELAKKQNRPFR